MKYAVVENFFDNFNKIGNDFKNIERYSNNNHPDLEKAKI